MTTFSQDSHRPPNHNLVAMLCRVALAAQGKLLPGGYADAAIHDFASKYNGGWGRVEQEVVAWANEQKV